MRRLLPFLVALPAAAQGIITTIAGGDYVFPDDGKPALQAHLSTPYGLAVDRQGNLIIADPGLNMILKMDAKGTVTIVAGNGLARFAGDGGPARAASLATPWSVAVDPANNIYVADFGNGCVRKIDPTGVITTVAGRGAAVPGDGLKATAVSLSGPIGVAFDPSGNMLIAEAYAQRIRSVNPAGTITTIAGTGQLGFSGDGGPAINASFFYPPG